MENLQVDVTLSDFIGCGEIVRYPNNTCEVIVNLPNKVIKVKNVSDDSRSSYVIIEDAYRVWMKRDDIE